MTDDLKMQIEYWDIDRLIPYVRNPRKNDAAVPKMAGVIKEFGFKVPIVAKSDGSVIDGHLRLKAAQMLGLKEVPVVLADEWTPAQVKAFRIAVNKSAEWADWDDELLTLELDDLKLETVDLELIGFNNIELMEASGEDMMPDDFDNDEFKDFVKNEDEYLAKKRIILVYTDEEEMFIRKLLRLTEDEALNVVYDAADLAARAESEGDDEPAGQD